MASYFQFVEWNGAQAPTYGVTGIYWKSNDGMSYTDWTSNPITAGTNSIRKYQTALFTGTFNSISNGRIGHTAGALDAGIALWYSGTPTFATPAVTPITGSGVNITIPSGIGVSYQPVLFGGAPTLATSGTLAGASGFSHFLITQLSTTTGAPAGNLSSYVVLTFTYDES